MRYSDLHDIFAENGVDLIQIILTLGAMLVCWNLFGVYLGSTIFPQVSPGCIQLIEDGSVGIILIIAARLIAILWKPSNKRKISQQPFAAVIFYTNLANIKEPKDLMKDILVLTGLDIVCYFAAEFIGLILGTIKFQTTTTDIYAFYISAAIVETTLFQAGIINIIQIIIARAAHLQDTSAINSMATLPACIVSVAAFVFVHWIGVYHSDPTGLIIVFLGGISQCFWYFKSKGCGWCISMGHIGVNWSASGSLIQSLKASGVNGL
jgi:hypothetical protein